MLQDIGQTDIYIPIWD